MFKYNRVKQQPKIRLSQVKTSINKYTGALLKIMKKSRKNHLKIMKNVHIFSMALAVFFFSIAACGGESEEEKQARLQAYQDSLRAVEQAKIAEMMEAMQDSIDAADSENVIDLLKELSFKFFILKHKFKMIVTDCFTTLSF